MLSCMELNHLRYFYEVAKSGSFTEAARRLHVSQSALSKAVGLLEESENVKLFERSKKGVTLTALGLDVFRKSEGLFQTVVDIENTCRGSSEVFEGPLRWGASDHITNYLLIKTVQKFCTQYPDVVPVISSGAPNDIIASLLSNEIEFGLFYTQVAIPQIIYEPITETEMVVVSHPRNAKALTKKMSPAELKAFIAKTGYVSSIRDHYQHAPSENLVKMLGASPRIIFQSNSQEAQKRFCIEVGGTAFLARYMVEEELKQGQLVELPVKPIQLTVHLARRKGRSLSPTAQALIKMID
jgi:DNA-binding transcriptional LysR family regulator